MTQGMQTPVERLRTGQCGEDKRPRRCALMFRAGIARQGLEKLCAIGQAGHVIEPADPVGSRPGCRHPNPSLRPRARYIFAMRISIPAPIGSVIGEPLKDVP